MEKKVENVVCSRLEEIDADIIAESIRSLSIDLSTVDLLDDINIWNKKALEIQSHFNFVIPNYILDEIIEQEDNSCKDNLYCLINCAVTNNRITRENAKKIRELY